MVYQLKYLTSTDCISSKKISNTFWNFLLWSHSMSFFTRSDVDTFIRFQVQRLPKKKVYRHAHCFITAHIATAETAHRLSDRILPFSSAGRDAAWDGTCADLVILVGGFKALVQRKRMMKATFVSVQGEAEVKETAAERARVRM